MAEQGRVRKPETLCPGRFSQAGTAKAQPRWARVCPDPPASESGELLARPQCQVGACSKTWPKWQKGPAPRKTPWGRAAGLTPARLA